MGFRIGALACAGAAVLAISACGGDGAVSSDDPASLAPASSPIYVQGIVRPKGRLKRDVETLASTVSGLDDPTGRLIELIDQRAREEENPRDPNFNFADDIEPWLGERAGFFAEGFTDDAPVAAIVQTTDPDAAQQAAEDGSARSDEDSSYKGVDYVLDAEEDEAVGVIDEFFVLGDEQAFKEAVDVSQGEDALGDEGDFTSTLEEAPAGSMVDVYASLEAVTEAVRADDPDNVPALEAAIGDTSGKTALVSLVPTGDSLEVDAVTNAETNFEFADLTELIGSFPAQSFAAIAVPNLGEIVDRTIDQLEKAGVEGVTREEIDQQLAATGLSLDDITGPLGDLGVFAVGTDRASLQGAGVITTDDPGGAEELMGKVTDLALRSPQSGISRASVGTGITVTDPEDLGRHPLTITTEGGRIVIGYGEQATEQALSDGGGTLADDPTFRQATEALGGTGLAGYVALPAVFRLADSLGAIADPGYQQARPYLDKLSYAVFGSGEQGDFKTSKVIIGVQG